MRVSAGSAFVEAAGYGTNTAAVRGLVGNDAGREKRLRELLEETAPKAAEKPKVEAAAADKNPDKKAEFKPAEAPPASATPPAPPEPEAKPKP